MIFVKVIDLYPDVFHYELFIDKNESSQNTWSPGNARHGCGEIEPPLPALVHSPVQKLLEKEKRNE